MRKIFIMTNAQKVLDFLIKKSNKEYVEKEIQQAVKISKAGTNLSLRDLIKTKLVKRNIKGKNYFYSLNYQDPVIRQLKVLQIVMLLTDLINKIKQKSDKIILYGSCSRGENTETSDIDLLVITNNSDEVEKNIPASINGKKIQLTIRTPFKYAEMEKTEPYFYKEIERGIVLWEKKD